MRHVQSKYKYVFGKIDGFKINWYSRINDRCTRYESEHDAAKAADVWLIKQGKKPVNVLKAIN